MVIVGTMRWTFFDVNLFAENNQDTRPQAVKPVKLDVAHDLWARSMQQRLNMDNDDKS